MQQQLTIIPHRSPQITKMISRIIIAVRIITIIKNHGLTQTTNSRWITCGNTSRIGRYSFKQYETLSDLIKEFKGKTHGSQSHGLPNNSLQIIVYYEVPEGMRNDIKRMFKTYTKNEIEIPHQ